MRVSCFTLFCSLFMAVSMAPAAIAEEEVVRVASRGDANAEYAIRMLKLALSKSGRKYRVEVRDQALTSARLLQELVDGTLDAHWTATSKDIEERTIPVRIPLYKGLLGYRVLLINRDNANLFSGVDSFNELKQYSFGQGRGWTDSTILEANGLDVVLAAKYESLFHMVDGGRFDAFPRGVHEPWGEITARPDLNLSVDTNVLLVYRMPYYLFVSSHRKELAEDIERGLRHAIDDGSFDITFLEDPTVKAALEKTNLKGRAIFTLNNPELPAKTPLENDKLWINIDTL